MKKRILLTIANVAIDALVTAATVQVIDWLLYSRKPIGFGK